MKLSKKLAVIFVLFALALSLAGCSTQTAVPAENRTTLTGEWKMDAAALNALAGVDEAVYADIKYLVEDLAVVLEFTDDVVTAAQDAEAAAKEAEAAAAQATEEEAAAAQEAALQARAAADEAAAAAAAHLEAAKAPSADFTQSGKLIIKVTANGETAVSEEAYTATYENGNYRVSIAGGEPNYFRLEDGKLVIVAHE